MSLKLKISSVAAVLALSACATALPSEPEIIDLDTPGQCKADDYAEYIGRNRSELPARPEGAAWRMICSSCAVTLDYHAGRMNIVYDDDTNTVTRIFCG